MTLQVAILGCGNRGADVYARLLAELGVKVAYLVDVRPARLAEVARRHGLPPERTFTHWDEFFALGRVVDAVVIATPDHQHVEPCLKALALDYPVLLEKPICLNPGELDDLLSAEAQSRGRVSVCHVLRAAPFFRLVAGALHDGQIGELVGIDLAENVAYWHYAHSFVRGNWRSSPPAAPFILAKSCHDLDVLRWFAARPPQQVSSTGSLHHFRPQNAPSGAKERCLDCPVKACPYDARRIYLTRPADQWPVTVLTAGGQDLNTALALGPYGECVYSGRNNVVDHQALSVSFEGGVTAQLTVSAFTHNNTRTLKLVGSHGEIRGHMESGEVEVHDFRTGQISRLTADSSGNHGGGDAVLVREWLAYLKGDSALPTPLSESVDSHRMAFAAEQARVQGKLVTLTP